VLLAICNILVIITRLLAFNGISEKRTYISSPIDGYDTRRGAEVPPRLWARVSVP
jgi:hypothetical protein